MKFAVLFLTACVLGSAVAHPRWLSSLTSAVSDTTNAVRQTAVGAAKATTNTAVNAAKATTNTAVNAAKATTNTAVNAAKSTTNVALNAAGTAKNMTINTAMAGVTMVADISKAAINSGIGFLIQQVKNFVRKTGQDEIDIPDIGHKAGPIRFNATQGYFRDITTLTQNGKANVTTSGATLKIDFPLKLEAIDIGYDQVNVTALMMNVGGGIKITIKNNTFIVRMRLTPGLTCAINVERVEVAELSGYDIDFVDIGSKTGEWVLEKASNLIINAIKGNIKSKVQEAVDSAIRSTLKKDSTICSKFLG